MTFLHQSRCTSTFLNICVVLLLLQSVPFITAKWSAKFEPKNITIHMYDAASIHLTITGLDTINVKNSSIYLKSDVDIINVNKTIDNNEIQNGNWTGTFQIDAIFLGSGNVYVMIEENGSKIQSDERLPVIIKRTHRLIDTLFIVSVAVLVTILNVNFGAALELDKLKRIFLKPIGPVIGLFCHFLFMPLVSHSRLVISEITFNSTNLFIFSLVTFWDYVYFQILWKCN